MRPIILPMSVLLLVIAISAPLWGRQAHLKLKSGQSLQGDVQNNDPTQDVVIMSRNVEVVVPRDQIESMVWIDDFTSEYRRREAALGSSDVKGRITLARWAFDERQYALAEGTLQVILATIDPNNAEAIEMLDTVRRQVVLEDRQATRTPRAPQADPSKPPKPEPHLLSEEQINKIKQHELTEADASRIRIRFDNDVQERYVAQTGYKMRDFRRLSAYEKFREIQKNGEQSLLDDVIIVNDPRSVSAFRHYIQPMLLNGCAAAGCHSKYGATGNSFGLIDSPENSEAAAYTNFYLLQFYGVSQRSARPGTFVPEIAQMDAIDRVRPDQSLIFQYGMARMNATNPHPDVANFRPLFTNPQDKRGRDLLRWLRSMPVKKPEYGFDAMPSTQPAEPQTEPATP